MKDEIAAIAAAIGLILAVAVIFSPAKWLSDPYFHKEQVTTVEWARREIDEVFTGERE